MEKIKNIAKYSSLAIMVIALGLALKGALASQHIDLEAESINTSIASPKVNENLTITVNARNTGTSSATTTAGILNYLTDFEDFTVNTTTEPIVSTSTPIDPGEAFAYTFEGFFTSTGTKSLMFTLDDTDELDEEDENNNVASTTVEVMAEVVEDEVDLKVNSVGFSNLDPQVDELLVVTVFAMNNGTIDLEDNTGLLNYDLDFEDFTLTEVLDVPSASTTTPIESGENFEYMFKGYFTATGTKTMTFTIDDTDELDEDNELNNSATKNITVVSTDDDDDDNGDDDDDDNGHKVRVCHIKGNGREHTIHIARQALSAHLRHGDHEGRCDSDRNDDDDDNNDDDDDIDEDESDEAVSLEKKLKARLEISSQLIDRVRGRILLQVEENGEAWYVKPNNGRRVYLKDGEVAYGIMRQEGLGIRNEDLEKIPVGIESRFNDVDSDGDGLHDKAEEGIGTDPFNADSDGDGLTDKEEVLGESNIDDALVERLLGRIVLQVEEKGQAWYINPEDGKRYYMKDGDAAYQIMRFLSLGIRNSDLSGIETE